MILLTRIRDSGFLDVMAMPGGSTEVFGLPMRAMVLSLNKTGEAFIRSLGMRQSASSGRSIEADDNAPPST
jgi:hypothetical protein